MVNEVKFWIKDSRLCWIIIFDESPLKSLKSKVLVTQKSSLVVVESSAIEDFKFYVSVLEFPKRDVSECTFKLEWCKAKQIRMQEVNKHDWAIWPKIQKVFLPFRFFFFCSHFSLQRLLFFGRKYVWEWICVCTRLCMWGGEKEKL